MSAWPAAQHSGQPVSIISPRWVARTGHVDMQLIVFGGFHQVGAQLVGGLARERRNLGQHRPRLRPPRPKRAAQKLRR